MLYSREFLDALDKQKNRTIYARITALKFDETPIERIEGRATGGSINVDRASAVRRSCSVTLVADKYNYHNYYWGLNTKFKLEIGMANFIDPTLPDIIWFPQGVYLITSFNTSRSTSNFTISISGKDKMCLLNGEISGNLEAQVDFGTIEEEDKDGIWTKRKIPIVDIIRNAVHVYGGEPMHNIIINDLPEYGLELLEYRYDLPMYLYRHADRDTYENALIDGNKLCRVGDSKGKIIALKDLTTQQLELLVEDLTGTRNAPNIYFDDDDTPYKVAKIEYGQTAGYRKTELVYAGELVANIGESLTSVLDKIKNMLGEFEYFYDIDGRFVFQQKKTYVNIPWSPIKKDEYGEQAVMEALALQSATAYTFSGGELITQFNNNPNLANARNDFVIRGERTGMSGSVMPVHMRYAIDTKPTEYTRIIVTQDEVNKYNSDYNTTLEANEKYITYDSRVYDWREVIYQMARDYYRYNWLENFEQRVAQANSEYYPTGRTGYEQYYLDLGSFWRDIYYPKDLWDEDMKKIMDKLEPINNKISNLTTLVETTYPNEIIEKQNILKTATGNDVQTAYSNLRIAKSKLEVAKEKLAYYTALQKNYEAQKEILDKKAENYITTDDTDAITPVYDKTSLGWHKNVFDHPEQLSFWFDFLDSEGELSNFNTQAIGPRIKAVNDTNIKAIYFKDTPNILFVSSMSDADNITAYKYIQVPEETMEEMFSISAQGKSAKDKLDELVNQHGYCAESATITAIPIYHLDANIRIYLHDEDTSLNGDYIVSKISLPLAYNGTMSITATKAPQNLLY